MVIVSVSPAIPVARTVEVVHTPAGDSHLVWSSCRELSDDINWLPTQQPSDTQSHSDLPHLVDTSGPHSLSSDSHVAIEWWRPPVEIEQKGFSPISHSSLVYFGSVSNVVPVQHTSSIQNPWVVHDVVDPYVRSAHADWVYQIPAGASQSSFPLSVRATDVCSSPTVITIHWSPIQNPLDVHASLVVNVLSSQWPGPQSKPLSTHESLVWWSPSLQVKSDHVPAGASHFSWSIARSSPKIVVSSTNG